MDNKKIIQIISNQIKQSFNLDIYVNDIKLNILKGIELNDVSISNLDKKNNFNIYSKNVYLIYNPFSFFKGIIDIIDISIENINLNESDIINIVNYVNKLLKSTPEKSKKANFKVFFRKISIRDSLFYFKNLPFKFFLDFYPSENFWNSKINFQINKNESVLVSSGSLDFLKVSLRDISLIDFSPKLDKLLINRIEGTLIRGIDDNLSFIFNGKQAELKLLDYFIVIKNDFIIEYVLSNQIIKGNNLNIKCKESSLNVNNLVYKIPINSLLLDIKSINLKIEEFVPFLVGKVFGFVKLSYAKNQLNTDGILEISDFKFNIVKNGNGKIYINNNKLTGNYNISFYGGELFGNVISDNILNKKYDINVNSSLIDVFSIQNYYKGVNKSESTNTSTNNILNVFKFNVNAKINKVLYQKLIFNNVEFSMIITNLKFVVNTFKGELYRGNILSSGIIDYPYLSGNLKYYDCKLKELSKTFFDEEKKLYGNLNSEVDFLINLTNIYNSLAKVNVFVSNGLIKDFLIQDKISEFLYNIPLDSIFFNNIDLIGYYSNQVFYCENFNFNSENIIINANGNFNVSNLNIDFYTRLFFNKEYIMNLPNPALLLTKGREKDNKINFNLSIKGSYSNPKFQISNF